MRVIRAILRSVTVAALVCWSCGSPAVGRAEETANWVNGLTALDVPGGLVVQIGAGDMELVAQLVKGRPGRFIMHVLETDPELVAQLQRRLDAEGVYGWVSVERRSDLESLPYTENLVNMVVVQVPASDATMREVARVLRPHGIVVAGDNVVSAAAAKSADLRPVETAELGGEWRIWRKSWPDEMDEWTHPRHTASGNAVSRDTLVGPPRRVRWLAGPWVEVANMVTFGGRNFYGGMLARDGFNGLRLWQRELTPSPSRGGFGFGPVRGAPPVTGDDHVFAFTDGQLQAIDGRTGETICQYPEAGSPQHVLYDEGLLITVNDKGVNGFDAASGRILWNHAASEPRHVVAGDGLVGLIQGSPRRGETCEVVVLDQRTGKAKWRRSDLDWVARASRSVYFGGMLTFEVSTLNDDGPDNAIHILSAADGTAMRDIAFLPGMNHMRQARAMFAGDRLWLLQGGRGADKKGVPVVATAIDVATGAELARYPAGLAHCFPPVATSRYLFSGEMDLTDLQTGDVDANRITKAACGRDAGWFPAHGLIYVTPKHCVCWPMLRGYAALAPERPGGNPAHDALDAIDFPVENGVAATESSPTATLERDWPCYRHDAWRSGSTTSAGPSKLNVLWSADLGDMQNVLGPILEDWREDPFIKGAVTAPVVAGDSVYVARPNAHQVVALDAANGQERWRFTANGRVDTPPTIHQGLCLFGSKSGWVYCLRAADGQLVWRMRVAPLDERMVAYGQLESPWPVPGSILVVDDVAYFAAGRQSFADGGILVFAVDPRTGKKHWVQRLDSVPQKGFYTSSALEFDNFDLLHREGDGVAMSRWVFDRASGKMSVDLWKAFARLDTGNGSAMVPQGCWSYAPRNETRTKTFSPRRPLVVFRDNVLFGCLESKQSVYRRDFHLESGEEFDTKWITGWANSDASRKDGTAWRSQRLAERATWTAEVYPPDAGNSTIQALVLAGDRLYVGGSAGELRVISASDGQPLAREEIPEPLWDGLAVAGGRAYIATTNGRLLCLGD